MMVNLARFIKEYKLLLLIIVLFGVFGYVDAMQIEAFHTLGSDNAWRLYADDVAPAFRLSWLAAIVGVAVVYYFFRKDKSEAIGLVASAYVFAAFGLEDFFFFLFSPRIMDVCMSWFDYFPYSFLNLFLGVDCTSPAVLVAGVGLGLLLGFYLFKFLRERF